MTRPVLPPHRCTATDEDANPCIRGRDHDGLHHYLEPADPRIPAQRVGA